MLPDRSLAFNFTWPVSSLTLYVSVTPPVKTPGSEGFFLGFCSNISGLVCLNSWFSLDVSGIVINMSWVSDSIFILLTKSLSTNLPFSSYITQAKLFILLSIVSISILPFK